MFNALRRRRRGASSGVEAKQRTLYWAVVGLGIDIGSARMLEELYVYASCIKDTGPMGQAMDEMYAERMIDGRINH